MIDMDDLCEHPASVGRISWPADLTPPVAKPNASAYVCRFVACQERAALWVEQETGHRGVFVRFEKVSHGR